MYIYSYICIFVYINIHIWEQEASYFAIYQVTDKGSSFAGPPVVSVITQSTGVYVLK